MNSKLSDSGKENLPSAKYSFIKDLAIFFFIGYAINGLVSYVSNSKGSGIPSFPYASPEDLDLIYGHIKDYEYFTYSISSWLSYVFVSSAIFLLLSGAISLWTQANLVGKFKIKPTILTFFSILFLIIIDHLIYNTVASESYLSRFNAIEKGLIAQYSKSYVIAGDIFYACLFLFLTHIVLFNLFEKKYGFLRALLIVSAFTVSTMNLYDEFLVNLFYLLHLIALLFVRKLNTPPLLFISIYFFLYSSFVILESTYQ